ncbi:recombinase family protein [Blautia sp. 2744]|uniref:Recombinase family protein n=1 Tax=Blautia intestinalis TaxID=2763028 RepID=A0ABR7I551_9FIRM|nr:recombinase family protein [Blautia intestinalis]
MCIEEGIDSSQTSGKLLISVLSAVAEIERENIIEQTRCVHMLYIGK